MADAGFNDLTKESEPESIHTAITKFVAVTANFDPTRIVLAKSEIIKKLNEIKVKGASELIRSIFKKEAVESEGLGRGLVFDDPDPTEDLVNLNALLDEIEEILRRYIVLPPGADTSIALWILHSWCLDAFSLSPLLRIQSPVKECGKSTLMMLIGEILPKNFSTGNMTTATVYRMVDQYRISLCIDEVDQSLKNNEELISLVNSGYTRRTALVPRCVGDQNEVRVFNAYCAKVLVGIGKLPGTTDSRAIKIHLKKKTRGERVGRLLFHKLEGMTRYSYFW